MSYRSLKSVLEKVDTIASTTKRLKKEEYIKEFVKDPDFIKVVKYADDPFKLYKMKKIVYHPNSDVVPDVDKAFEFLDEIIIQSGASNEDRKKLGKLCSVDEETVQLFNRIINKDLRCSVGISTWKKYISGLEEHKVMLCIDDVERFLKTAGSLSNICWSLKKDGVRTWAIVDKSNTVTYLSRNGKTYSNFKKFDEVLVLAASNIKNERDDIEYPIIFDGEVSSNKGVRDFDTIISNARSKSDIDDTAFQYAIFDIVNKTLPFNKRYDILKTQFGEDIFTSDCYLLKHEFNNNFKTIKDLIQLMEEYVEKGEEGLVAKVSDGPYEFKKSAYWCKLKKFEHLDLSVVDVELGNGKLEGLLGALVVDFNGVKVTVGSGFTDEDRKEYLINTPQVIEVKFQEITKDGSLRFPVFVRVREDKY